MGEWNFSRKQCVRALLRIGFHLCNKGRNAGHEKYCPPEVLRAQLRETRSRHVFVMVPRHKDLHCQDEIVNELRNMGGNDLVTSFKVNL